MSGFVLYSFPLVSLVMIAFLKLLARLPMRWYDRLGILVGWSAYFFARKEARRLKENLRQSNLYSSDAAYAQLLKECIRQTGKNYATWFKAWLAPQADLDRLCAECDGWSAIEQAQRAGKGIIFLWPHLGAFPIIVRYTGRRLPLTVLFRVPRYRWRRDMVLSAGQNAGVSMAPTNRKGVEELLRALKRGEAIALPPDQAPNSAGGVWADFFGKPAYTMTLAGKLHKATGAALIAGFAERLPAGNGFRVQYVSVPTANFDEAALNRVVEDLVRRSPSQFNWCYNRYKTPRAAIPKAPQQKRAVSARDPTSPIGSSDR